MNPTNTFFIGNDGIVQLDDVLISMAGARKSSGGNEPEPGPEPEPEPDDPIAEVKVTLKVTGNVVVASAEGDTSTLSGYEFSIGSEKKVNTGVDGKVDFAELGLEYGEYVVTAVAVSNNGGRSAPSAEEIVCYPQAPAAMTLRFEFSKSGYSPVDAGVGSAGTWKKVDSPTLNVWDWTNEDTDWSDSFKGAFPDADNEVSVIAAGDTSSVTSITGLFAGIFTSYPQQPKYSLTSRNNIVSCVPFDVSNCTDFSFCFTGTCLRDVVKFHYNNLLTYSDYGIRSLFADTYVTEAVIDLYGISAAAAALFARCEQLKNASLKGVENITNIASAFHRCSPELNEIIINGELTNVNNLGAFAQNASNVSKIHINAPKDGLNLQATFNGCRSLTDLSIQVGKPSRVDYMFAYCCNLKKIPLIDTSACAHLEYMMYSCENAEAILDYDVSSATNVKEMCRDMFKAKSGILELYNKLLARGSAITDHTNCFLNCGRDTEEGRAAIAQIPTSWGGLKEE